MHGREGEWIVGIAYTCAQKGGMAQPYPSKRPMMFTSFPTVKPESPGERGCRNHHIPVNSPWTPLPNQADEN